MKRRGKSIPKWKRFFDVLLSSVLFVVFLPLIPVVVFAILIVDGDGVIYKQKRLGYRGKLFNLLKFRTMYKNGDAILEEFFKRHPEKKREWEIYRKLKDDPRVTPVGKVLRKLSLDELPQLLNVLKGDMSIVGPRPYLPEEMDSVPNDVKEKILSVKPGITGLWQVSGRNETTFEERVKLDAWYAENYNLWLDLKILWRTIFVILSGRGAY